MCKLCGISNKPMTIVKKDTIKYNLDAAAKEYTNEGVCLGCYHAYQNSNFKNRNYSMDNWILQRLKRTYMLKTLQSRNLHSSAISRRLRNPLERKSKGKQSNAKMNLRYTKCNVARAITKITHKVINTIRYTAIVWINNEHRYKVFKTLEEAIQWRDKQYEQRKK